MTPAAQSTMILWLWLLLHRALWYCGYDSCCTEIYDTMVTTPVAQSTVILWLMHLLTTSLPTWNTAFLVTGGGGDSLIWELVNIPHRSWSISYQYNSRTHKSLKTLCAIYREFQTNYCSHYTNTGLGGHSTSRWNTLAKPFLHSHHRVLSSRQVPTSGSQTQLNTKQWWANTFGKVHS